MPELPGVDLQQYKRQLVDRFSNPYIGDRLTRIAGDGSSKLTKWTMPSTSELLSRSLPFDSLALIIAAWFQYLQGEDEQEQEIAVIDPRKEWLQEIVAGPDGLSNFLRQELLFMEDLRQSEIFQRTVASCVHSLRTGGIQKTLRQMLSKP